MTVIQPVSIDSDPLLVGGKHLSQFISEFSDRCYWNSPRAIPLADFAPVEETSAPPCTWFSCNETLNFSLDNHYKKLFTPAMFLKDNALAISNPEFFKLTNDSWPRFCGSRFVWIGTGWLQTK